jgi:hypothetical protein
MSPVDAGGEVGVVIVGVVIVGVVVVGVVIVGVVIVGVVVEGVVIVGVVVVGAVVVGVVVVGVVVVVVVGVFEVGFEGDLFFVDCDLLLITSILTRFPAVLRFPAASLTARAFTVATMVPARFAPATMTRKLL